jgi:hypothetical protein
VKIVKIILYSLLALDVVLLLWNEPFHEALDSIGWIILLGAFEYESSSMHEAYASVWEKRLLIGVQLLAWGLVLYALVNYIRAGDWLDIANSVVWLLVCVAISYDVYANNHERALPLQVRNAIKVSLYIALAGFAILWGLRGDPLDLFDSVLWIVCFLVIELNIFKAVPSFAPIAESN